MGRPLAGWLLAAFAVVMLGLAWGEFSRTSRKNGTGMTSRTTPAPIARWHVILAAKDAKALDDLLADDVVFQSPAVHSPQKGKVLAGAYLRAAMKVLGNPTFRYLEEWYEDRSAVLEFELTIDGIVINGVDIVHWNDEGRIVNFKVMLRPLKALNTIVPLMAAELEALKNGAPT
jgi:SnoaL-like domain